MPASGRCLLSPRRLGGAGCGHAEGGGGLLLQAELQRAAAGRPLPTGAAATLSGTDVAVQQERHALQAAGPGAAVTCAASLHAALTPPCPVATRWS